MSVIRFTVYVYTNITYFENLLSVGGENLIYFCIFHLLSNPEEANELIFGNFPNLRLEHKETLLTVIGKLFRGDSTRIWFFTFLFYSLAPGTFYVHN